MQLIWNWLRSGRRLFSISAGLGLLLSQPYRPLVFVGESMAPSYQNLEVAWTLPAQNLHHGDVVVLRTSHGTIVKRVAMLPGDRIPQIYVGKQWSDLIDLNPARTASKHPHEFRTVTVPAGRVYVLGDNRMVSLDSRTYGLFSLDQIERVVIGPRPRPRDLNSTIWVASSFCKTCLANY